MKQFLKSAAVMSFGTLLSRISGFFRDICIANYLGSGFYSDIFFIALKIPNFFRQLFAEGAFNSAFTPIFASGVQAHGKEKMMIFARNIYSILLYFLLLFTLMAEIGMPYLIYILAPGFVEDKEKVDILISLARLTFPYLIFISGVSFMSSILNTFNKFFVVSIMPIILNVTLIVTVILFGNFSKDFIIVAMSYAVSIGGLLQFLWILFFTLREKAFLYPVFPRLTNTTKTFFSKFVNSFVSCGVVQINSMIDAIIATLIPGAVSMLYYGDRVAQFPLSLIGTAIGISILPTLSKTMGAKGNRDEAQNIQENAIFLACFLGIPSAVGLFTLSNIIIEVLFQRGQFTAANTVQVATILKIYSIALPFFIFSKILQTIFFAKKDTKTPMKNSIYCLIINIVCSLSLVFVIGANGIAISTTLSSIFGSSLLFYQLIKNKIFIFSENLKLKITKIIYSVIIMAVMIYSTNLLLMEFNTIALIRLIIAGGVGGCLFLSLSHFLNILNIKDAINILLKKEKK